MIKSSCVPLGSLLGLPWSSLSASWFEASSAFGVIVKIGTEKDGRHGSGESHYASAATP